MGLQVGAIDAQQHVKQVFNKSLVVENKKGMR